MSAKEKILEAADGLFGEVGFDAATTREIAQRSGVNKALIHYHFQNKEALLVSVLDRYYENLSRTLVEALKKGTDFREKMAILVETYIDFLDNNRNFARIVQREASGGRNVQRVRTHMVPLFQMGKEVVHEAFPTTRSGVMAAEHLLISFYGIIISYFTFSDVLEHLLNTDPFSTENLRERKKHVIELLRIILEAVENEKET